MSTSATDAEGVGATAAGGTSATDAEGKSNAHRDLRLFLAPLICLMLCLVLFPTFTILYMAYETSQVKIYEAQQQELNNHKFCGLVDTILAPQPPTGSATSNPSRAFEQILHAKFLDLKVGLGC